MSDPATRRVRATLPPVRGRPPEGTVVLVTGMDVVVERSVVEVVVEGPVVEVVGITVTT